MNATWLSVMIAGVTERIRFYICRLGKDHLILGLPWLKRTNPLIDWKRGMVRIDPVKQERKMSYFFRKELKIRRLVKLRSESQERNDQGRIDPGWINPDDVFEEEDKSDPTELWLRAKMTISQRLVQGAMEPQQKKAIEETVPKQYLKYQKVFKQMASERLPEHGKWDHAIDLDPNFVP